MILLCFLSLLCSASASPYYVKAGVDESCPGTPCNTLQEYAAKPPDNDSNITMLFLEGEHHLSHDFSLRDLDNLIFGGVTSSVEISVLCSHDGRLIFENIETISINDISMTGCYGNDITDVTHLAVVNVHVQGLPMNSSHPAFNVSEIQEFEVVDCTFGFNEVRGLGAMGCSVFSLYNSHVTLLHSVFDQNRADSVNSTDGVSSTMCIFGSDIVIVGSSFTNNLGWTGGVVYAKDSSIVISDSKFLKNAATFSGGCTHTVNCTIHIVNSSLFEGNSAEYGGALKVQSSEIHINNYLHLDYICDVNNTVVFSNNSAILGGALNIIEDSVAHIHCSTFELNRAESQVNVSKCRGGAILARTNSNISLSDTNFYENVAGGKGGVLFAQYSAICSSGYLTIQRNRGNLGVVYFTNSTANFTGNLTFVDNQQSFFAHSSEVTFAGESEFKGGVSDGEDEGGAITADRSAIAIFGRFYLHSNEGYKGGGVHLTESSINVYGQCTFLNNTAFSGGAVSAYKSDLKFSGDTVIQGNVATNNGGGIFLVRSALEYRLHFLSFRDNTAFNRGGAIYFDQVSTLYIVKEKIECENEAWYCVSNPDEWLLLTFSGNSAKQGGALFVNDYFAFSCYSKPYLEDDICTECFIQIVASYSNCYDWDIKAPNFANIFFTNNTATDNGSLLYGGLLDRCIVDKHAEQVQLLGNMHPFSYFGGMCNRTNFSKTELASDPLRICFCDDLNNIDCSMEHNEVSVQRGETFPVKLVVVDQMNSTVNGTVMAYLSSESSRLSDQGQSKQNTGSHCTVLEFTVFSAESDTLNLYADGPCDASGISVAKVDVNIISGCPVGFSLSNSSLECICHPVIQELEAQCVIETRTILRRGNYWVSAWKDSGLNDSDWNESDLSDVDSTNSGIIVHKYCPYDYCYPPSQNVSIALNYENGSDGQCAFNRCGSLCGCCDSNYSLTLGSSKCDICTNYYLLLIIPFGLAGIALVILMMACNLTLASGTLNGLLFYANILIANRAVFFPFQEQSVLTIFVSWLGLNLGIATCFFNGMDAFSKMWIQISFEVYLIVLMVVIILLGRNVRISTFFHTHKLQPVSTLATLVMLSYEKFFRKVFSLIAYTKLEYPNGKTTNVLLSDPCFNYGMRHIPLAIIAICIVITGVIFNFILLFNKIIIARCRSVYFNTFMAAYFAPFKPNHQYWVGLLLLIRNLSYLTSEFLNAGGNPSYNLHFIFTLVIGILLIKFVYASKPIASLKQILLARIKSQREQPYDLTDRDGKPDKPESKEGCVEENGIVYKSTFLDILETSFLINLLVLTYFTLYLRDKNQAGQYILFNISSSFVLVSFVGILVYHTCVYTRVSRLLKKRQQGPADETVPLQSSGDRYGSISPTHSEI